MPISCHFRDCKTFLVTSLTRVRIASTGPSTFLSFVSSDDIRVIRLCYVCWNIANCVSLLHDIFWLFGYICHLLRLFRTLHFSISGKLIAHLIFCNVVLRYSFLQNQPYSKDVDRNVNQTQKLETMIENQRQNKKKTKLYELRAPKDLLVLLIRTFFCACKCATTL